MQRTKLYEPPFAVVWAGALALVLPIIVLNSLGRADYEVSNTISTSYEGTQHGVIHEDVVIVLLSLEDVVMWLAG
jgi:hypothetical protein